MVAVVGTVTLLANAANALAYTISCMHIITSYGSHKAKLSEHAA